MLKDVRALAASTPNEVGLGHLALASPPIAGNVTLRRPTEAHSTRRTAVARARAVGGERAAFKRSRVNDCGGIGLYHFNDTHMRSGAALRPASGPRRRPGETERASLIGAHPASWWWTESPLIGLLLAGWPQLASAGELNPVLQECTSSLVRGARTSVWGFYTPPRGAGAVQGSCSSHLKMNG